MKQPAVYMMASKRGGTIYTGVTSDLVRRAGQHQSEAGGFSAKYHCTLLVWFEMRETMEGAILREQQIKAGSWAKKVALIEAKIPAWYDLYDQIL
jgi:putative endonuclease